MLLFSSRRPYCIENAGSHLNSTAKRCKARSVLGWGTARELQGVDSFILSQCELPDSHLGTLRMRLNMNFPIVKFINVTFKQRISGLNINFPIVKFITVTLKHRSEPQQIVRQSLLSCLQHLDAS